MLTHLRSIDWKALMIGVFACYVLPMVLGFVLAEWIYALNGCKRSINRVTPQASEME